MLYTSVKENRVGESVREGDILCEFNIRQLIQISVTVSSSGQYSAANQNKKLHLACISVHNYTTIKREIARLTVEVTMCSTIIKIKTDD